MRTAKQLLHSLLKVAGRRTTAYWSMGPAAFTVNGMGNNIRDRVADIVNTDLVYV